MLSNAQAALFAAALLRQPDPEHFHTGASEVTRLADSFLEWLDEVDETV